MEWMGEASAELINQTRTAKVKGGEAKSDKLTQVEALWNQGWKMHPAVFVSFLHSPQLLQPQDNVWNKKS